MHHTIIGQSLPRLEDRRFLTGEGKFIDDINLEGQLYGAVLRSPYAHAIIEMIDTNAAANLAGVVGVYTSNDLDAEGIGNLPCVAAAVVRTDQPIIVPPRGALARERVRHVGDPVVFVVAEASISRAPPWI